MSIKYRVNFDDGKWTHYDTVSMTANPGWLTCWYVDANGQKQNEPTMYYPNERIIEVLRYETGAC